MKRLLTLHVSPNLYETLFATAKQQEVTGAEFVRQAIKEKLERIEIARRERERFASQNNEAASSPDAA